MKQFKEPEILVEKLEVEDVITTSGDIEDPVAANYSRRANQLDFS